MAVLHGNITDVPGILLGLAYDTTAVTGCSVLLMKEGARAGVSVRGGAPGTRETDLLDPGCRVDKIYGLVLSGGSAFGLETAGGVMRYLEEQEIGLSAGPFHIPIVPAAILFDLSIGDGRIRPDASWGYRAATQATRGPFPEGSTGAGTGATVGKALGLSCSVKSGQASLSISLTDRLIVGVLVVVNALGDVLDEEGKLLAGPRDPVSGKMSRSLRIISEGKSVLPLRPEQPDFFGNTTLAVIATNAGLSKAELARVADGGHNGLARAINPLHTSWDGDTVFAVSTGNLPAAADLISVIGSDLLEKSVRRAIRLAQPLGGIPSAAGQTR